MSDKLKILIVEEELIIANRIPPEEEKPVVLVSTLKNLKEKLGNRPFLRIHRSFKAHLKNIDEIATSHVLVKSKIIPLNADSRKQLLKSIQKV